MVCGHPTGGSVHCDTHRQTASSSAIRTKKKRRAAGLCWKCGKRPHLEGTGKCAECGGRTPVPAAPKPPSVEERIVAYKTLHPDAITRNEAIAILGVSRERIRQLIVGGWIIELTTVPVSMVSRASVEERNVALNQRHCPTCRCGEDAYVGKMQERGAVSWHQARQFRKAKTA